MESRQSSKQFTSLSFATLGVVYGDIGTSPLYAMRESLSHIEPSHMNILGVLSLIFWALVLVVSIKYLLFIFYADNEGEGGTIALLSLLKSASLGKRSFATIFLLGLLGTSLLFADGMITPAISVISAVEGLTIISPHLSDFILPITLGILFLLFLSQARGIERLGFYFGFFMVLWFVCIASLGTAHILHTPVVLRAIDPWYAIQLIEHYHWHSLFILTGIFLVITGSEALFADIGHFGKSPIRFTWFSFVLPCLLLNYFGQGANLYIHPEHVNNPFYLMTTGWLLYPLVIIATMATIIASQAVISAVFSIAKQAITLEFLPRLQVTFTSATIRGQVYVPTINLLLGIGTIGLVIAFQSSSNLASAYGLAVNLDMFIVTILICVLAYKLWHWAFFNVLLFAITFFTIDLGFLAANSLKFVQKGWFPFVFAIFGTVLMLTWRQGSKLLYKASSQRKITIDEIARLAKKMKGLAIVPGTAVYVNEPYDESKRCLFNQLQFNRTLHEVTIVLDIKIVDKPLVDINHRVELVKQKNGLYHFIFYYGFIQSVDLPNTFRVLEALNILPFTFNHQNIIYHLEMVNAQINPEQNPEVPIWQKRFFIGLLNNLTQNAAFYHLPFSRTIMVGSYYEI